jgi:HTH-type transcriptional regulator/antitoxin HipB
MIKLNDYIDERLKQEGEVAKTFWEGYEDFIKIGVLLKDAREKSGLTQDEVAARIQTTKSVISRMENHAADIRLSTLKRFAQALGMRLRVTLE